MTDTTAQSETGTEVEALLRDLLDEHEALLATTGAHREAIGRADTDAMRTCIVNQNEIVQRIAELDQRRAVLTGGDPQRTLSHVADELAEPGRSRLLELSSRLRELMHAVARENRVIRQAATAMVAQMEGIVRQVARQLNHAGVYDSTGSMGAGPAVVSGLDLSS